MIRFGKSFLRGLMALVVVLGVGRGAIGGETADAPASATGSDSQSGPRADWQQRYKDQLAREDNMEGRSGQSDQVEAAMKKLMDEITKGSNEHAAHTGGERTLQRYGHDAADGP